MLDAKRKEKNLGSFQQTQSGSKGSVSPSQESRVHNKASVSFCNQKRMTR